MTSTALIIDHQHPTHPHPTRLYTHRTPVTMESDEMDYEYHSAPKPKASWNTLPNEIKLMIFEELRKSVRKRHGEPYPRASLIDFMEAVNAVPNTANPEERGKLMRDKVKTARYPISRYAAVSREWVDFWEKVNFKHIILNQDDIAQFAAVMRNRPVRISFVSWIWLRLMIPSYNCTKCNYRETPDEIKRNNALFTNAIWDLFATLSTWGKDASSVVHPGGVTLELSAESESDHQHYWKELAQTRHDVAWRSIYRPAVQPRRPVDKHHGWVENRPVDRRTYEQWLRITGPPIGLGFDMRLSNPRRCRLSTVDIVTRLVMRQQSHRHLSVSKALELIFKRLVNLRELVYECNPARRFDDLEIRIKEHQLLCSKVLNSCKSLRRVSLFDYREEYRVPYIPESYHSIGKSLMKSSQHLEELYGSRLVDAEDFFSAFWPGKEDLKLSAGSDWSRLRFLSLSTCRLDHVRPTDSKCLIEAAGRAAQKMPKLEIMEIYGGRRTHPISFGYYVRDRRSHIKLRSSWPLELSKTVLAPWHKAAQLHSGGYHQLRIEYVHVDVTIGPRPFYWPGSPHRLELSSPHISSTTGEQIAYEESHGFWRDSDD